VRPVAPVCGVSFWRARRSADPFRQSAASGWPVALPAGLQRHRAFAGGTVMWPLAKASVHDRRRAVEGPRIAGHQSRSSGVHRRRSVVSPATSASDHCASWAGKPRRTAPEQPASERTAVALSRRPLCRCSEWSATSPGAVARKRPGQHDRGSPRVRCQRRGPRRRPTAADQLPPTNCRLWARCQVSIRSSPSRCGPRRGMCLAEHDRGNAQQQHGGQQPRPDNHHRRRGSRRAVLVGGCGHDAPPPFTFYRDHPPDRAARSSAFCLQGRPTIEVLGRCRLSTSAQD